MIGTIDVKVQAHNPNFPLDPVFTFVNSSQSFRIRDVPKRIGNWSITNVFVNITYPDNTVISKECLLVGGVWVGTVNGCSSSGQVEKGFVVTASGIDENNQTVSNYVLGAGDIYVKQLDGTVTPGKTSIRMFFYETIPTSPNEGDSTFIEGVLNVYDGTQWKPVAQQSDPSYIEDTDGNKINADRTFIEKLTDEETEWKTTIDNVEYTLKYLSNNGWNYRGELVEGALNLGLQYDDIDGWAFYYSVYTNGRWSVPNVGNDYESPITTTQLTFDMMPFGNFVFNRSLTSNGTLASMEDIPTKTSDLTNDSNFISSEQVEPFYNFGSTVGTGTSRYAAFLYTLDNVGNLNTDGYFGAEAKIGTDLNPQLEARLAYNTYHNFELSKFFSQTYSPSLELIFWKNGSIKKLINNRPRQYYDGCMYRTAGAGFAIPCSSEGVPDGRLIEFTQVSNTYIAFTNEDTQVHTITGNTYWTSIETIDGQSGEITCTRTNQYKLNTRTEKLAKESQLPTKTSDLTNDSGFITAEQVPTQSYIEDTDGNRINANLSAKKKTAHKTWYVTDTWHGGNKYSLTPIDNFLSAEFFPDTPVEEESWGFRIQLVQNGDDYTGTFYDYFYVNSVWELNEAWEVEFLNGETSVQCAQYFVEYSDILTDITIATTNDLPTKTSDLTNDSGFITVNEVPTPDKIEDSNGNKINADGSCVYAVPVSEAWKAVNSRGNEFILEWNSSKNKFEYELPLQHRIYLYYDDGTSYWELEDSFYDSETGDWSGAGDTVMDGSADSTVLVFEMLGFTCTRPVIKQDNLARVSQIPTKTSDLTNDSNFVTQTQMETYVNSVVGNINTVLDTINGEVI